MPPSLGHTSKKHHNGKFKPVTIDAAQMFRNAARPMQTYSSSTAEDVSTQKQQEPQPRMDMSICSEVVAPHAHRDAVSDMTQSLLSSSGVRFVVRDCIRRKIFPLVKFYDKEDHDQFSLQNDTVCGIVLHFSNAAHYFDAEEWWRKSRTLVHQTHTIHRNNCIKAMHRAFISKFFVWC